MKGGENIDRITTTERVEGRRERKEKNRFISGYMEE